MKRYIYFDHAATTPVAKEVFEAMRPYFQVKYGNPSSLHSFGLEAGKAVEKARQQTADFLNCSLEEIVFTSGATESNNLAVRGLAHAFKGKGHIITSSIEHPAVLEPCQALEKEGFKLTKLPVSARGIISLARLKKEIRPDTFLISVMYVNNEIGTVQPIQAIGRFIEEINKSRKQKIYFHTDAVQAAAFYDCWPYKLKTDLLSLSGHKIYGPKGVGVLFVKKGVPLKPIQFGGYQEKGLRPGTINPPLIVGLGKALALAGQKKKREAARVARLSRKIIENIKKNIPGVRLNGDENLRSPSHLNFSFQNIEGESLLLFLDQAGVAVSTGSACASHSLAPSPVLRALGLSDEKCHGSVRFSLGYENTEEEVNRFLKILPALVKKIRARSPLK